MGFIENMRNALASRLEGGYSPRHLSDFAGRQSYSTVGRPENDFKRGSGAPGQYNRPDESREAYGSLRRGEDVNNNGKTYNGGIYGTRFLGENPNDFLNAQYFSDKKVSDKYKPLRFTIIDRATNGEKNIEVSYDDDGAIASITDGDRTVSGANNLSDYFKGMSWDDGRYSVYGGGTNTMYVLGDGNAYTPTYIFGSRGRGSYNAGGNASKRWTLDNPKNKKAFVDYYRSAK